MIPPGVRVGDAGLRPESQDDHRNEECRDDAQHPVNAHLDVRHRADVGAGFAGDPLRVGR